MPLWYTIAITKLLQQAFEEASQLCDADQDEVAIWLIAEIRGRNHEYDDDFDRLIAGHPEALEKLAAEALAVIKAGRVQPLDFDRF